MSRKKERESSGWQVGWEWQRNQPSIIWSIKMNNPLFKKQAKVNFHATCSVSIQESISSRFSCVARSRGKRERAILSPIVFKKKKIKKILISTQQVEVCFFLVVKLLWCMCTWIAHFEGTISILSRNTHLEFRNYEVGQRPFKHELY